MTTYIFEDDDEACEFCKNKEYDINATSIQCKNCGVTYYRCNEIWIIDSTSIPKTL